MKYFFSIYFTFAFHFLWAQSPKKWEGMEKNNQYISFNFFSIAAPQFAIGPSAGCWFTERSEIFIEAAYVATSPFYTNTAFSKLRGSRWLLEYRYHFFNNRKRILPLLPFRSMAGKIETFIGIQGMVKPVRFNAKATFINPVLNDTLYNYPFTAKANTLGLALIGGSVINLSSNEKWKLEIAIGLGGKDRKVKLKNIPSGYQKASSLVIREWLYIAPLHENAGGLHMPISLRLRYSLN
jgi:hypothetical protein